MTQTIRQELRLKYGRPNRRDLTNVVGTAILVGLMASALAGVWAYGLISILGGLGGLLIGVLLVASWSLRDGFLQGDPGLDESKRVSARLLAAALIPAAVLLLRGLDAVVTGGSVAGSVFAAWLLFVSISTASANREVEGAIVTHGRGRRRKALIVYHSARGGLMRTLQEELAKSIEAQGWQVDLSTASRLSPTDLSPYQLLVLGAPCYNRGPAASVVSYLDRVGDLGGMPVMIVVSGFNYTEPATRELRSRVERIHGRVIDEIEIWTKRPIARRFGATEPNEVMRRAGAHLAQTNRRDAA